MRFQDEEPRLVASDEVIDAAGLRESQQEVVVRVGGPPDDRKPGDDLGEIAKLIDKATSFVPTDTPGDQNGPGEATAKFVDLLLTGQQSVNSILLCSDDLVGGATAHYQRCD
jgi:hypothetical protein